MIPPKFVEDVQKQVDKGKITAEEGAEKLSNFCYCGIFNQIRCAEILNIVSEKKKRDATGA
jgi:predicted DNA-binding protein (UPF0278 family)